MSYRVETAASCRAGCKNAECKNAGIKIDKDELRLGVWVEFEDRGGWQWRHWGCVTGKMLENIRKYLEGEDNIGTGEYRWDFLDGLDGEDKNSLSKHPDLQEKVKSAIIQGFIDPEDWNGDPEMNKLGVSGTRTAASKKKARADKLAQTQEIEDLRAKVAVGEAENEALRAASGDSVPKKKAASKKRAKKEESDTEDDVEEALKTPAKKKRATKAKKEEEDEDGGINIQAKSRAKKSVKEEDEESEEVIPAKKPRGKQGVKKEESVVSDDPVDDYTALTVPQLKDLLGERGLAKSGRKADLISRLEDADVETVVSSPVKPEKNESEEPKPVKDEPVEIATMADAPYSAGHPSGPSTKTALDKYPAYNADAETIIPGIKDDWLYDNFKDACRVGEVPGFEDIDAEDLRFEGNEMWEAYLEEQKAMHNGHLKDTPKAIMLRNFREAIMEGRQEVAASFSNASNDPTSGAKAPKSAKRNSRKSSAPTASSTTAPKLRRGRSNMA